MQEFSICTFKFFIQSIFKKLFAKTPRKIVFSNLFGMFLPSKRAYIGKISLKKSSKKISPAFNYYCLKIKTCNMPSGMSCVLLFAYFQIT